MAGLVTKARLLYPPPACQVGPSYSPYERQRASGADGRSGELPGGTGGPNASMCRAGRWFFGPRSHERATWSSTLLVQASRQYDGVHMTKQLDRVLEPCYAFTLKFLSKSSPRPHLK